MAFLRALKCCRLSTFRWNQARLEPVAGKSGDAA